MEFVRKLIDSPFFHGRGLIATVMLSLCFVGMVGLDQVSKYHAHEDLVFWEDPEDDERFQGRKISLLALGNRFAAPDETALFFGMNFQYSRNKGAAFSMLSDIPDYIRVPLFHAITLFAVILISFYLRATPIDHRLTRYGLLVIAVSLRSPSLIKKYSP